MEDLLTELIDSAQARAGYADARFVRSRVERLSTRNGALDQLVSAESEGIGIRVRVGGAWGFAAVRGTDRRDAEAALERALAVAEAQPRVPDPVPLAPEPPARGEWSSAVGRDPFAVPVEEKLAVLLGADAELRTQPGVSLTMARFSAFSTEKLFASTDGALCEQRITECGGGIAAVAVDGAESQTRSYPASHGGHVEEAGYEHFVELELAGHAPRVSSEAVELLKAPPCPPGRTTLILAGEQLAVRGNELRAGRRDRLAAVRLRARERDRGRDEPGRARHLPLGRRGRGGAAGADRPRGCAGRLSLVARDGRRDRARPLRRLHAGGGVRAPADRAHDEREP